MSKKLLLADDSVVIQKLVGLSFANENVEIIYTDNGDDAILRAREIAPDLVLADVVMPGKNGYEVCEAIKQDPSLAHVPVLLLTGTFEAFDENRAASAGADGQITKPFEAQALVSRITEVMNNPPAPRATASIAVDAVAPAISSDAAEDDSISEAVMAEAEEEHADVLDVDDPVAPEITAIEADSSAASFDLFDHSDASSPSAETPLIRADDSFEGVPAGRDAEASPRFDSPRAASPSTAILPPAGVARKTTHSSLEEPPALPPSYVSPPPIAASNAPDAISAMQRELTPDGFEDADSISALEVDEALASGMPDQDATIFVADEDANARTSPGGSTNPTSLPGAHAESSARAASKQTPRHAPSAPIDRDQALGGSPTDAFAESQTNVLYGRRANDVSMDQGLHETVVTNLDERLSTGSTSSSTAPQTTPGGGGSADREPVASPFGVEPLDTTDSEFLDIGPYQHGIDLDGSGGGRDADAADLDFGFDVSEQQDVLDAGDPLDSSFSSLMDVSDSQILGSPIRPAPLMTDYDVSSSDLGAALPPRHSAPESAERLRAPTHSPTLESEDAISRNLDSDAESDADAYRNAAGRFGEAIDLEATPTDENEFTGNAQALAALTAAAAATGATSTPDAAREVDSSAARTPDLSPLMEQRIQETLEKVAWEAFSDLSESIVKQVMARVENIAWEVIPQMAETLIREEIRQMKDGEDD